MRNFIQRKISVVLFVVLAAAFVVSPSRVDAQGWRLFVDDVKKEAKGKRARENGVPTSTSPDANADDGEFSNIAPDVPPLDPDAETAPPSAADAANALS
ncbi:MAG: hypothetical protein IKK39_11450, partial [Thermoguttaceae bacterium]|nr:hypothetical protein [Thermoguttaceae bacterium]